MKLEPVLVDDDLEPINPLDQDRRMRAVLISMQCLMYGSAMNWNPSTSQGKPTGGNRPPGETTPLHQTWQHAYVLAAPEDRETVIANATDALIAARKRTTPIPAGETLEEWEARLINECEGLTAREAALRMRTGTTVIVRIRRKRFRDPNDGTRLPELPSVPELIERGMTPTQIAAITGWSKQRVQYHVRKLAA